VNVFEREYEEKERKVIWRGSVDRKRTRHRKGNKKRKPQEQQQKKKKTREKWKKKKKSTSAVTIADEQQDLDCVTAYDETGVEEDTHMHT